MVLHSSIDLLLFVAVILLVLATGAAAFWPPHRHRYDTKIGEHWDFEGHHYECFRCACGKKKERLTPIEDIDPSEESNA